MKDAERRQEFVLSAQAWVNQPIVAIDAFKTGLSSNGSPVFTPAGLLGLGVVKLFSRARRGVRLTVLLVVTADEVHLLEARWRSASGWTVKRLIASWPRSALRVTKVDGLGLRLTTASGEPVDLEPLWPSSLAAEVSRVLTG